jgi:DNA invertase Pin-like site-specific DNA recombinase
MVVIVGAIVELERSLIVERVKAGMRRARLEGRRIGRAPLNVDRAAIVRDRLAWSKPYGSGEEAPGLQSHRLPSSK